MKRIRIGKDIEIHWPILTNGEQVALEGRDLKLFVHLPSHMDIPVDFTTEGNTAIFTISGTMQKSIGVYRLTMWENLQKSGQTAVDYCKAFELVPTTLLEGGEDESNLTTETVDLEASSLVVGLPGESAYEAFKKYNPNSELTEEEYAEAPINAANAANEAAKAANDAAGKIGDIDKLLAEKVDKEEGKGLSTNDYTDQEKEKLAGLSNYDDTEIKQELSDKVSKKELTEAAAGTLTEAKSYTDTEVEKAKNVIGESIGQLLPLIGNDITAGDADTLKESKSYTDTKTAELWNNVGDTFDAMSEELNSNISGGDAQTLTEAKNYTDKAISEIPTPDVSGQIERHNTSPTAHPDIRELLNTCVGLPEFNDKTYELTFTTKGGAKFIIDLPIEMMGLHYNEDTQSIEFVNADGSISSIPVSDFVKVYVGSIGSEIQVTVEGSEIRASLLNNTVSWDKLTLALQEMIQSKADRTELPTKLSELENDSGYVTSEELNAELGYKDHVAYILKDFTKSYYNNTGSDITDRSMVVTPTQSGVTSNFSLTSRIPVAASDFIFVRMKLRVDKECSLRIITYSDNLDQRGRWFALKADRTYEIYYRGKAASVVGRLNVGISIPAATNIGQKVTIEDLIVTLNNYDAWCDAESRATLKNFDTDSFTVDEGGTGHFFSVAQACDFARDAFDVVNNAVTVFIRNGLYDHEAPKNVAMGYPYAIINKGANRISLIGESRDGVIVSYENNSVNRAKIIEAGGECTVANMTVNCLNDESYTDASAGGHQACYCVHVDSTFAATERYFTTIRNCKLFSTCHSPVGAGLTDNQTIRLDGCECVSDTHVGTSTGAATIHASTDAAAKNMAVEIIGCRLLSLDGTKALYMPDVAGGTPFTQVDVTLLGNTYYTTGPEITDADFLSRHKLTPWSDASFSEISVIAHSDCTLEARVTHLERLLVEMLSGKVLIPELQVKKLGVWDDNNLVVTGEGAPTKAPDRAGQFYVDTKNNAVYHSVGNGAVSDWKNA